MERFWRDIPKFNTFRGCEIHRRVCFKRQASQRNRPQNEQSQRLQNESGHDADQNTVSHSQSQCGEEADQKLEEVPPTGLVEINNFLVVDQVSYRNNDNRSQNRLR
eukprot:912343_1